MKDKIKLKFLNIRKLLLYLYIYTSITLVIIISIVTFNLFTSKTKQEGNIVFEYNKKFTKLIDYISILSIKNSNYVKSISLDLTIKKYLEDKDSYSISYINQILKNYNIAYNSNVCYVMDSQGITIGASNYDQPKSFVNKNYSFRPYFIEAIDGNPYIYTALGVTSNKRGIYYSYPIFNDSSNIIGVAVIKFSIKDIEDSIKDKHDLIFLTNNASVIFITNKKETLFRSINELSVEKKTKLKETRQFSNKEISPLKIKIFDKENLKLDNKFYKYFSSDIKFFPGWNLYYIYDFNEKLKNTNYHNNKIFYIVMLILLLLFLFVFVPMIYNLLKKSIETREMLENEIINKNENLESLKEALEAILFMIPVGYIELNDEMKIVEVNKEALNLLNCKLEDVIYRDYSELFKLSKREQDALKSLDNRIYKFEDQILNFNNNPIYVLKTLVSLTLFGKKVTLIAMSDITEILEAKELAEQANKMKSEFITNISHELRTPLTSIIGFAEILSDTKLDDEQISYLQNIHSSGNSLLYIINELIEISKIESGNISYNYENTHIPSIIKQLKSIYSNKAKEKGIDFVVNISESVNNLRIDPIRLKQIISNLLSNAIKFTNKGNITLDISVKNDKLLFKVSDTGIGIEESIKDKIFIPFIQGDSSLTKKYEGLGIGLAIVKKFTTDMNGSLDFTSKQNKGTTFYVEFPVDQTNTIYKDINKPVIEKVITKKIATKDSSEIKLKSKIKILIVDDYEFNILLLKSIIEKNSLADVILTANCGRKAIDIIKDNNFDIDLIFMDIQMPDMSGIETMYIINKISESIHIPCIAITADAMKQSEQKYLKLGFDSYISKPFKFDKIINEINRFIKKNDE